VDASSKSYQNNRVLTRPDSLPSIFRNLRIHHHLTREEVALKLDVSVVYVAGFEEGHVVPSLKFCLDYGDLFGFNQNWIKVKWANWVSIDFRDKLFEGLGLEE